jgi:hypothetical protein
MKRLDAAIAPVIKAHLDQWYFALDFEFDSLEHAPAKLQTSLTSN